MQIREDRLVRSNGTVVAKIEHGIIRFPVSTSDASIDFYRSVGGAHFHERSIIPFAMSSLDTPIYHACIDDILPSDRIAIIVDVGGGDGRNALRCLKRNLNRIVIVDVVGAALVRFRSRISDENPEWLEKILFVEADARSLPLSSTCAETVIAIETLCYLNEDYEVGLKECARLLSPTGRLLVSDRDYEGGLLLRLLYDGLQGMLQLAHNRSLRDGPSNSQVRSRCFTQSELLELFRINGLKPIRTGGTSVLSLLLGYLNNQKLFDHGDNERLPEVIKLLSALSHEGSMRRCHIVIAERSGN
jgi:SAM-dependent methyltransferase